VEPDGGRAAALRSQGVHGQRRQPSGDNPLGDRAQELLRPYLGEQSGLEGLSAAADALEQALIEAGYSFHRVSLPPQSLDSGQVELRVVAFALGQIAIEGTAASVVPWTWPTSSRRGRSS